MWGKIERSASEMDIMVADGFIGCWVFCDDRAADVSVDSVGVMVSVENAASSFGRGLFVLLALLLFVLPVSSYAEEDVLRLLLWKTYAPEDVVKEFEESTEQRYGRKVKLQATISESPDNFFAPVRGKLVDVVTMGSHLTVMKEGRYRIGESLNSMKIILPPPGTRRDRNGLKLLWEEALQGIEIEKGDNL